MSELRISNNMKKSPARIDTTTSIEEALMRMQKSNFRHYPVTNEEGLILGIVSERDLNRALGVLDPKKPISSIMQKKPYAIYKDERIENVLEVMISKKIGSALIQDDKGQVIGIYTTIDALKLLKKMLEEGYQNRRLSDFLSPEMEFAVIA